MATASTCWYEVNNLLSMFVRRAELLGPLFSQLCSRYRLILMLHGVTSKWGLAHLEVRNIKSAQCTHLQLCLYLGSNSVIAFCQPVLSSFTHRVDCSAGSMRLCGTVIAGDSTQFPIPPIPPLQQCCLDSRHTRIAAYLLICLDVIDVHVLLLVLPHWVSTWSGP
jgi:hypothetical protein